ncbi:MAG: ATP-binding protein [Deltaproteobacteria bacterium]|nr:ATP-binding protein [Deltaproteobacteria bacterium]
MKELVVISGKGGTGKTSITAALAGLAKNPVLADADVDAPDLELVIEPSVQERNDFYGGVKAGIDPDACIGCGECAAACRFDAIAQTQDGLFAVKPFGCEGCGVCHLVCPAGAVALTPRKCGQWFVSHTRFGPMVHARLGVAEENSGKLVATVRKNAGRIAQETGADAALIVAEPTKSAAHDAKRTLELCNFFQIPTMLAVNKCGLYPEGEQALKDLAGELGAAFLGGVPYDPDVTRAMVAKKTVVEYSDGPAARAVRRLWENIRARLYAMEKAV